MLKWLITRLVDSGWVRLGLAFRWFIGTEQVMFYLTNEKDLDTIKKRYQLIENSGFFSESNALHFKKAFLKSLFAYDAFKADAFTKALESFYSWNKSNIKPLEQFFDFIINTFFQSSHAEELKKCFIEATFMQHQGEHNAIASAAWPSVKSIRLEENPLALLLDTLDKADCFKGPDASAHEQHFAKAISKINRNDENALSQSFHSKNLESKTNSLENSAPNFYLLMKKGQAFSKENKEILIQGLLYSGRLQGVLSEVMWIPEALDCLFDFLTKEGFFDTEQGNQLYINKLMQPDILQRTPLYFASLYFDSLKRVYKQLKILKCFDTAANKNQLITTLFTPTKEGDHALSQAKLYKNNKKLLLQILEEARCFEHEKSKQQFIDTFFITDSYGQTAFNYFFSHKADKFAMKLKELKFLEGPHQEANRKNFITAVFLKNTLDNKSPIQSCTNSSNLKFFIDHLDLAGCFSNKKLKQQFIDMVFSKDKFGWHMLSSIYEPRNIILLLDTLKKCGCFDSQLYKTTFIRAIKDKDNSFVSHCSSNIKSYLALRSSLKLAGFSSEELAHVLNQSHNEKGLSPYMKELSYGENNAVLLACLEKDGAKLSEEQINVMAELDQKRAKIKLEKSNFATVKQNVTKELKTFQEQWDMLKNKNNGSSKFRSVRKRSASFSGVGLFDTKRDETPRIQDDCMINRALKP